MRRAGGELRLPLLCSSAPHRGRTGNTGEVTVVISITVFKPPPHTHTQQIKWQKDVCFINYL